MFAFYSKQKIPGLAGTRKGRVQARINYTLQGLKGRYLCVM